jgi:hypothetical protein
MDTPIPIGIYLTPRLHLYLETTNTYPLPLAWPVDQFPHLHTSPSWATPGSKYSQSLRPVSIYVHSPYDSSCLCYLPFGRALFWVPGSADMDKALDHELLQSALYNMFQVRIINTISKYRMKSLLRIVSGICQYAWIHTPLNPIVTPHYHPIESHMKEVFIKQDFPDTMH